MNRLLLITFLVGTISTGCKDSFNDPNPDAKEIIDLIAPTIEVLSPVADSTYIGIDTVPIRFNYADDYFLSRITVNLTVLNAVAEGMNFSIETEDSMYSLDTFYVVPSNLDTLNIQIINNCKDYAENSKTINYTFDVIK